MATIKIVNIGSIKEAKLDLTKINIIMGPQSSGKSTIAKIISYCHWVEKRYLLDKEYSYDVSEHLLEFHRMSEEYFCETSLIEYDSEFVNIQYSGKGLLEKIVRKNENLTYDKTKNIYIPAERNFVTVIPNLGRYKETNDNIMSFLYDWYSTKKKYTKSNSLGVLNLGVNYYHVEENDVDVLVLTKNNKEISLRDGSSGLQSVIPLTMLVDYLTGDFYKENLPKSYNEIDSLKDVVTKEFLDFFINSKKSNNATISKTDLENFISFVRKRSAYHHTNFIIEEPEQNLFPETQRDLIYYIFEKLNACEHPHSLLITTHSPFILYAVNNCLMGFNIKEKMPLEEQHELQSMKSWIDTKFVSIYEIKDGKIYSIKDLKTGTVTKHYFNQNLNALMNEYYEMLSYFEYNDKHN